MANTTIVLKKSGVPGNVPSVLANGELSINYADGKLFYRAANGTITSISGSGGSANSFATINANSSLILATSNNDTLSIVPGNNISFTTNTTTKSITIHSNTSSGGGTAALNGFSPNTVITANSTGYLSNTTNLNFFTSNNNLVITGNIIAGGVRSTSSGSTPPSSPTVGDVWYDTSTDIMYRYTYDGTNSNWIDITSPTVSVNTATSTTSSGPKITSVVIANSAYISTGAYAVALAGGYILVNGSGFESIPQVTIGTQPATSIGFVSSSQLQVQVPAQSGGTYPIYVTNSDGSVAINVPGLTYNQSPVWSTGSTLTSGTQGVAISIQLAATDDGSVTYAVSSGSSLPSGLSLSSGGLLSGTVTGLTVNTTYNFSIDAVDSYTQKVTQAFSITITVGDTYFPYTTLLLNGDGTANSNNNIIVDSSNNAFTVTRSGTPTQGTFTPFPTTGTWSNFFNGSSGYLTAPSNAAYNFGTGDFTVETWVYLTGYSASYSANYAAVILGRDINSGNAAQRQWWLQIGGTASSWTTLAWGQLTSTSYSGTSSYAYNFSLNTWYHIAAVKQSGVMNLYVNGTSIGSQSVGASNDFSRELFIGQNGYSGFEYYFPGYISNLRIVKGTALYTSTFTPSTAPLSVVANTVLLTCQANRFIDSNTTPATITVNGTPSVQRFNPFGANLIAYSTSTNSGSIYFNYLTPDYLSIPNSVFNVGASTDFTIEFWIYPTLVAEMELIGSYSGGSSGNWLLYASTNLTPTLYQYPSVNGLAFNTALKVNTWNHIAIGRTGATTYGYLNGVLALTISSTSYALSGTGSPLYVGVSYPGRPYFNGYMSNIRLTTNRNLYTSAFTPSTTPLTPVANTSLLLSGNNAGIIDGTMQNNLITVGDVKISTTQSKFGGSSIYFDGNGDGLSFPSINLGAGNLTVEWWGYQNSNLTYLNGDSVYAGDIFAGSSTGALGIFTYSASQGVATNIWVYIYGVATVFQPSISISLNQWNHFALTRASGSWRMFVNGTQVGTTSTTQGSYNLVDNKTIGYRNVVSNFGYFPGYIDDFRITKGVARYTTTFTPPTSALPPL